MIRKRFLCKTNRKGITIIPAVVVMLLLFSASCSKEKKDVVEVRFDPEQTYTLRTTDVTNLISDSGITRYRLSAKEWLVYGKAAEPYSYFPGGIYVEKFDTLFHTEASIKADTAYNYDKKGLWKLVGNVEVNNLQGENFQTSLLFWDQKKERIYTDRYFRFEQKDQIITGIGFESNQDMTNYRYFNSTGVFPITEAPADSTGAGNVPSENVGVQMAPEAVPVDSVKIS